MANSDTSIWPTALPAPLIDRVLFRQPESLTVRMETGRIRVRPTQTDARQLVRVVWNFTSDQYAEFYEFFRDTLEDGSQSFLMEWDFTGETPVEQEFEFWQSTYALSRTSSLFSVSATLEIIVNNCIDLIGDGNFETWNDYGSWIPAKYVAGMIAGWFFNDGITNKTPASSGFPINAPLGGSSDLISDHTGPNTLFLQTPLNAPSEPMSSASLRWKDFARVNRAIGSDPNALHYRAILGLAERNDAVTWDATAGVLRNDFAGWVGMKFSVGATCQVSEIGRLCVLGNTQTHTVKLVNAFTAAVMGTVSVDMLLGTPGEILYATLPSAVTLEAGATYYIVSQETVGGDEWYNAGTLTIDSRSDESSLHVGSSSIGNVFSADLVTFGSGAFTPYVGVGFKLTYDHVVLYSMRDVGYAIDHEDSEVSVNDVDVKAIMNAHLGAAMVVQFRVHAYEGYMNVQVDDVVCWVCF